MNNTELSIQIDLDGFSFSLRSLTEQGSVELVAAEVKADDLAVIKNYIEVQLPSRVVLFSLTESAMVVPAEVYQDQAAKDYLMAMNLCAMPGRVKVACPALGVMPSALLRPESTDSLSDPQHVVVWALDGQVEDYVGSIFPNVEWSHPLVPLIEQTASGSITVFLTHGVAHIVVSDMNGRLHTARSVRYTNGEDLLYFAGQALQCDGAQGFTLSLCGTVSAEIEALFRSYYAVINVVADPLFLVRL
ncbi:MAG: hypothetical protein RR499_04130 [Mucinivorans sp.]